LSRFDKFVADPFAFVDNLNLSIKGNNFNLFQKYKKIQATAFWGAMVFLVMWIIAGFDSNPLQIWEALYQGLPVYIRTGSTATMVSVYQYFYGKEMHYSAFVIYFLLYWAGSRSWEKAGILKSKNMVFSFAGMFLAIGIFEWFWMASFAVFQHQPWVITWRMPQLKIILQNTGFIFVGGMATIFMLTERWYWSGRIQGPRAYYFDAKNWKLWLFVGLSMATALFWIYYPFYVHQFSVQLKDGTIWQSSRLFPQTLYTIKTDPAGSVNAGAWFWFPNDAVHAVNTIVKAIWAATVYFVFRVKPAKKI
jgi:hypothetical protein